MNKSRASEACPCRISYFWSLIKVIRVETSNVIGTFYRSTNVVFYHELSKLIAVYQPNL